ncbi:TylF/MycF/NovP-related O-methyltransferase [Streptomyces sp. NPDC002838]|uniref:TylF/MycF/NovP-related O-methyltransferase n=1 Tax=Streptomyces sp. NPDC002838 TaxID=3154436 RepID=UPI003332BAF2
MDSSLRELSRELLADHGLTISEERINCITPYIQEVSESGVPGTFVELGCHRGAMAVWTRSVLDSLGDLSREIHVYDSFQGMPSPGAHDSDHVVEGELRASPDDVLDTHARWGKRHPAIHEGWFEETLPYSLPDSIAFGYLDGDFYESIVTSLEHCVPRLSPGAVLIIDDYADLEANPKAWNGLPGVKTACDDFFGKPSPVQAVIHDSDLPFGVYRHV